MSYWYRGEWIDSPTLQLAYDDPALIYGASVFTTCRVYGRSLAHPLTMWAQHQQRLCASLRDFHWPEPDWSAVLAGSKTVARDFPVVRISLFPDGRELIWGRDLPVDLEISQHQGIVAEVTAGWERTLPHHKTGNYLAPWLARQQVTGSEAILTNAAGEWLETSTGNLWGWRDGIWYIPPLAAGILPGIGRAYLVQWLRSQGKIVNEQPWDRALVAQLMGLAYSNSVVQFIPIHTVCIGNEQQHYEVDRQMLATIWPAFLV